MPIAIQRNPKKQSLSDMKATINLALVDDHQILLDGIAALLSANKQIKIVLQANQGDTFLEHPSIRDIDLLIMDINMDGKDGIQVLQESKEKGFTGACIFLTSYNDLKLVNESIKAGAKAYVTKANSTEYLEDAITQVLAGEIYYSPDIKDRILNSFSLQSEKDSTDQQETGMLRQLTEREREVLQLIAQQHTSEEIAKKLYIAKSTVDTHRKNLINKLKVKNAVGLGLLGLFAERHGLI